MDSELEIASQLYQVNVVILEGRHLAIHHANTKVNISIGKRKKTIHAKNNKTDCPYYNDFCVFLFRIPLNVLLDEIITIRVYEKSIRNKLIGGFSVDLLTVWSQPNHQFYHKWAVLTDLNNATRGVRGFLKCDIGILSKGVVIKPPSIKEEEGLLEDNLLVPYGGTPDRQITRVVFSVFRADSFSSTETSKLKLFQPYIKITYGGRVGKTSVAKNQGPPVWNEELAFLDFFPPLTQNILVEIFDRQKSSRKSLANTNIEIGSLFEDGKDGFLPTFGPNFLYLYRPFKKFERHRNGGNQQNAFTYMGRLLIALRTEVIEAEREAGRKKKFKIQPKPIPPLKEKAYFEYNKFILFAAIFDALFFDPNLPGKNINIRLTFGPRKSFAESEIKNKSKKKYSTFDPNKEDLKHLTIVADCNTTRKQKSVVRDDYSFINFSGKFPCVHVFGEWPDSLQRMYRSNIIRKVIQNCKDEVNKIKYDLQFETGKHSESSQKLKATLDHLSKSCEGILLLTNVTKMGETNLSKERKRVYHKEIADIALKAKIASNQQALKAEDELQKISTYLARLTKYAQDPENSFPDIEVWLMRHNKAVAQYRMRTEDVTHSKDFNNQGLMSGKPQTILFRGKKGKLEAKLDIFVWFGLADEFVECLKMLPDGLKKAHPPCLSKSGLKIPSQLIYEEKHHFQLRAHIFQGKILVGFDQTGLADPFVRIIVAGQNKKTQVRKTTLSPVWDETLVFPQITLYGPSNYIKHNPMSITVEVFDNEKLHKGELIGRGFVTPFTKLKDEKYGPPQFPPKLKWEGINSEFKEVAKVLITTELLEVSENLNDLYSFQRNSSPLKVPDDIRPHNVPYRLEVLFWGVRQLQRKNSLKNKVLVTMECGENIIKSPVLHNVRHKLNFLGSVQLAHFDLPKEPEYAPPLSIKLFHIASITHKRTYVGNCLAPSVRHFVLQQMAAPERTKEKNTHFDIVHEDKKKKQKKEEEKKKKRKMQKKNVKNRDFWDLALFPFVKCYRYCKCKLFKKCEVSAYELAPVTEEENSSWWLRYHASEEDKEEYAGISNFKIYREELEAQSEFQKFQDFLRNFDMVTGHDKSKKGLVVRARVKAAIALYKWPPESNGSAGFKKITEAEGILSHMYSNNPLKFVARVYVICGINLAQKDIYGSADPYLHLQLGDQKISDRHSYKPNQLNPTFGKCYEFKGTFPHDHLLRIKVIDHDDNSHDDLIGETIIDIENRYYSKYHATCGLAKTFETRGSNFWRDIYLPSEILKKLCETSDLKQPLYEKNRVVIDNHEFATPVLKQSPDAEEIQALMVLNRWHEMPFEGFHLVPEHVETRSLYHPAIPGIEQGKLQLWVDIFPADFRFMPPKVDITPQLPVAMELRAIVWNVVDVVLDDRSFLVNGRISDIYLKGWILSLEEEMQRTDIHYKSLNGQGNFNWRFIFHFNYIPLEGKILVKKKKSALDKHPEERKLHCKLEIQVWDNDMFGDDYLGTLILELSFMPRGAKLSNRCTLKMLAPNAGKINLFKIKKTRGWWPFRRLKMKETVSNEFELTGKIDLELEILTEAEAKQSPAGKGREEPNPLPPPIRPDTSFNWFLSPIKVFRYILWRRIVKFLIISMIVFILVLFILIALYALPNYLVKKMVGA